MVQRVDSARPQSGALLANLEETRREVVVPPRFQLLLDAVERYYGVRQVADKLLVELFHPLRNLDEVAGLLKNLTGSAFSYYERTDERVRCAELMDELFGELYDGVEDTTALTGLVGSHLELFENLRRSPHASSYREVAGTILERLLDVQARDGRPLLRFATQLRRVGRSLPDDGELTGSCSRLYAGVVRLGLDVFWSQVDLGGWAGGHPPETAASLRSIVATPLARAVSTARAALAGREDSARVLELPHLDELLDQTLERSRDLPGAIERIGLYVHLAGVPELTHRNMEVLRALYFAIESVCASGSGDDIVRAVDLITDHLAVCEPAHKRLLYKCLEKLGGGIARGSDDALVRHFVERAIATGFEAPDIRGVSEEWQTFVNPHHLPCLRAWLAVIERDPITFEELLSALLINLHFRGVFVADTDLFQRDISALLNSDIADAFNLIVQLVGYFPVFFNEVGSEGELREVSTRIDQLLHRRDPVIHFLRKQSHAESNNRLVGFAAAVYRYWRTGDAEPLAGYLPAAVLAELDREAEWFQSTHRVVEALAREGITEERLDKVSLEDLEAALAACGVDDEVARERVLLLVRLYRLLKAKYSYDPGHLLAQMELSPLLSREARERFAVACAQGDHLPIVSAGNGVLEELKDTIIDGKVTEAFENIYHKRHIAAGIPSMYGTYSEPKFDAMGLFLRVMQFLKPHLEGCVADFNFRYMTRESIRAAHGIMAEMLRGLRIAGLRVQHLTSKLGILERGIALGTLSAAQFLNILDFMSEALNDVVESNYIALHDTNLERMARRLAEECGAEDAAGDDKGRLSERFLRDVISSTYAIQELDLILRRMRQSLRSMTASLSDAICAVILTYTPTRLVSHIHDPLAEHEDQLCLGYKGYSLKVVRALGLPVPDGFVISTELFRLLPALGYEDLMADTRERLAAAVARLEEISGRRLGDPTRPLLLSVRSGAAFSMPGMMDTILNVGLNEEVIAGMSGTPEAAWGAWDCYRRYLQNVAMSRGAERDRFDQIMLRFKERHRVERKTEFTPTQMRDMALAYRDLAAREGVELTDDPLEQLTESVFLVMRSWESEPARIYRSQLQLADAWGTAVIVQQMVFGNMNASSGSGVVFTRNPRSSSTGIGLFGDFTRCSQGEDVVGGLVHPYPVSEKQRLEYSPQLDISLESQFPDIYGRLRAIASELINEHGYEHQEIEFTFSSGAAEDLSILQIRPMRLLRQQALPVFVDAEAARAALVATGIGVSGGALSGRVAFSLVDVRRCREQHPDDGVILLRPDTVPEDIHLVLGVDGLLTARGGFTSHAAVTAKRLGKCCVVNCKALVVDDTNNLARIGGRALLAGDPIAIDGLSGRVYLGEHAVTEMVTPVRVT